MNKKIKPEKRKAAELILKYMGITGSRALAIQCAQMACNEMINYTITNNGTEFLKQVRKQIDKY